MRQVFVGQVATALVAFSLLKAHLRVLLALRGRISRRRAWACAIHVLRALIATHLGCQCRRDHACLVRFLPETCQVHSARLVCLATTAILVVLQVPLVNAVKDISLQAVK